MLGTLATLLLSSASAFSVPPLLADVYVDVNAVDCAAGTGGPQDPVCSIGAAVVLASPGDTIRIAPGTYMESVLVGLDLNLIGTGGADVTIINPGGNNSVVRITNGSTVVLDGLTLTNGRSIAGGGINMRGNLTLRNSVVTGNEAREAQFAYAHGGGIRCVSSTSEPNPRLVIENSTISNNRASGFQYPSSGGGITASNHLEISNSTISGNSAFAAGGIAFSGAILDIRNSTISGNNSDSHNGRGGQGLRLSISQPGGRVSNCTVTGTPAGSLDYYWSVPGNPASPLDHYWIGISASTNLGAYPLELINTIVASDILPPSGTTLPASVTGSITSLGHNLIGVGGAGFVDGFNGDQVGSQATPLLARLGPLGDNGGTTQTREPLFGSPAIDAGDSANFVAIDQRGVARPLGSSPDVGAVESLGGFGSYCNGDGGDLIGCTNCPCMNDAPPGTTGGCLNSAADAARLIATGVPSVSLSPMDLTDLRFGITGAPTNAFCILNSGDGLAPSNMANPCFGLNSGGQAAAFDGLRCAITNTRRHGGRSADINGAVGVTNSPWGGEGGPPVGLAVAGGGFIAGQTRYFQVINRDDPLLVCMRGLNTSQAVEVTFTP